MIRIRTFLNSDMSALAEIWRSQPPRHALVQPLTPLLLERVVLSKPYFDRERLLLAFDDDHPVGFVHAAFGPSEDRSTVSNVVGVIAMLMVVPRPDRAAIAGQLLAAAEALLTQGGARTLLAGGIAPNDPFYLGLYGGSELPGILESDVQLVEWFRNADYRQQQGSAILECRLADFRPVVNRQQIQIRRQYQVASSADPAAKTWWEACTFGQSNRLRYSLAPRGGGSSVGSIDYWDLEPLASSWGVHAAGISHVEVHPQWRQQGLGTFLVGESLRQLQSQGVTLIEGQVPEGNEAGARMFRKLGFEQVDRGLVLVKELPEPGTPEREEAE